MKFEVISGLIWIHSTNQSKDGAKTVQAHRLLMEEIGYNDSSCMEESDNGKGFQISVCGNGDTIEEMKGNIYYIKAIMKDTPPTLKDENLVKDFMEQLY